MSRDVDLHASEEAVVAQAVDVRAADPVAVHASGWSRPRAPSLPASPTRCKLICIALLGGLAAVGVGYLASQNPRAAPGELAGPIRTAMIAILLAVGAYGLTRRAQKRMGRLLLGAGGVAAVWLLNGSAEPLAFSTGVIVSAVVPPLFASLLIMHPAGRFRSATERRFMTVTGAAFAGVWIVLVLSDSQPPVRTPLLRCAPHCPPNVFALNFGTDGVGTLLRGSLVCLGLILAWGTTVLLMRRARLAPVPIRRAMCPAMVVAWTGTVAVTGFVVLELAGARQASAFGTGLIEIAVAIPVAIFAGLGLERLFMGGALADFVTSLAEMPSADPQALMAVALRDPLLRIAYRRPLGDVCVDASGTPVATSGLGPLRAVTWIERDGVPIAAVIHDAQLSDQDRFVQAAGAAALLRLERIQLQAELAASIADLAASRTRLVDTADAERQRIERDLHDSVQQDLVGLRIKLEMAAELIETQPGRGQRMVASVGRQIDDVLNELRSLARGIYPTLLGERGVAEALTSAIRRMPRSVSISSAAVGRYAPDVETAVYFCCLEALQNFVKHAGAPATARVRLHDDGRLLRFEVRDDGVGFCQDDVGERHGLVNMRDRIEAVGGTVAIASCPGRGTVVTGSVPARRRASRAG